MYCLSEFKIIDFTTNQQMYKIHKNIVEKNK